MGSLRWALSWLIVVVVGLAPMLVYWVVGLISGGFQRRLGEDRRVGGRSVKREKSRRSGATQLGRDEAESVNLILTQ
jgi:hypothetical protein